MDSTTPHTPRRDASAQDVHPGLKALARLLARQAARDALSVDQTTKREVQDEE